MLQDLSRSHRPFSGHRKKVRTYDEQKNTNFVFSTEPADGREPGSAVERLKLGLTVYWKMQPFRVVQPHLPDISVLSVVSYLTYTVL